MLLHVQSQFDAPRAVVAVCGEMDMSTADLVRVEVVRAIRDGCRKVTLDLNRVTFIDSICLDMLVGFHQRLGNLGGALRIVTGSAPVLRMLAITGLDLELTIIEGSRQPVA